MGLKTFATKLEKWQRHRERLEFLKRVDEDMDEDHQAMERFS